MSRSVEQGRAGPGVEDGPSPEPLFVEVDQPVGEAFLIRESDDDIHLLEGMLQQTLGRYRDRAGVLGDALGGPGGG